MPCYNTRYQLVNIQSIVNACVETYFYMYYTCSNPSQKNICSDLKLRVNNLGFVSVYVVHQLI